MGQKQGNDLYLSIGVTGHRDLVADEYAPITARIKAFFQDLKRHFPGLPLQLLTPLAEGGDQLAAEQALAHGLRLVAVLPMEVAEYEKDFQGTGSLEKFRDLLGRADQVIVLPDVAESLPQRRSATRLSDVAAKEETVFAA